MVFPNSTSYFQPLVMYVYKVQYPVTDTPKIQITSIIFYLWPKMKIEAFQVSHPTFRNFACVSSSYCCNVLYIRCTSVVCVCGWHCSLCSLITSKIICQWWYCFVRKYFRDIQMSPMNYNFVFGKQEPTPNHFCHFIAKNSTLYNVQCTWHV